MIFHCETNYLENQNFLYIKEKIFNINFIWNFDKDRNFLFHELVKDGEILSPHIDVLEKLYEKLNKKIIAGSVLLVLPQKEKKEVLIKEPSEINNTTSVLYYMDDANAETILPLKTLIKSESNKILFYNSKLISKEMCALDNNRFIIEMLIQQ